MASGGFSSYLQHYTTAEPLIDTSIDTISRRIPTIRTLEAAVELDRKMIYVFQIYGYMANPATIIDPKKQSSDSPERTRGACWLQNVGNEEEWTLLVTVVQ